MKMTRIAALAATALLTLTPIVSAQTSAQDGGRKDGERGQRGEQRGGGQRGGGISMQLLEQLGLTEVQKAKLGPLTEKQREEMNALRAKHLDQIKVVLTPEQRKKLESLRASQRGRGQKGGGG
jgi:Spy/CpxP family protein refolding chaperone